MCDLMEEYMQKRYGNEISAAIQRAEDAERDRKEMAESFAAFMLQSGKTIEETVEETKLPRELVQNIAADLK